MSDNENNGSGGSPIDRSKRPRFDDGDWDSDYERDGHDDRHPKRLAVPDPETKAPHFVPSEDNTNSSTNDKNNTTSSSSSSSRRKKWEEKSDSEEEDVKPPRSSSSNNHTSTSNTTTSNNNNTTQVKEEPSSSSSASASASTESISIRSLVGTKDAGVIIGRGGKNVSDIRELSSARVTISEIVPGAYERILTVSGPVNAVAKVSKYVNT